MDLGEILLQIIIYLIFLVLMTIFLKIALSFFSKSRHTEFGNVFLTSFLITIILFLFDWFLPGLLGLIIALILIWLLISVRHHTGFGYAILISIIALLLYIVVLLIIGWILGISLFVFPFP
jgi:hypothetical protein